MVALLVLIILVALVSVSLMAAMMARDDSYLGIVGLGIMMVAGFMAMTYGALNAT